MRSKYIVSKFGGTSMRSAEAIARSAQIAIDQKARLIVVSAVGGVTNLLVDLKNYANESQTAKARRTIKKIEQKHLKILKDLDPKADESLILEITDGLSQIITNYNFANYEELNDEILASGEALSSKLMLKALEQQGVRAEFFEARKVIKTDDTHGLANPDVRTIKQQAEKFLMPKLKEKILVTQGFVGSSADGLTTTIGRGGSDYSAALFAEAIEAERLQIWTDVTGISTADPKIVKTARKVPEITFQEAAELATAGAKILHAQTIAPMRRADLPIYVGNSFSPETQGTNIYKSVSNQPIIRAITIQRNRSILRITAAEMAEQFGYLAKIVEVFAKYKINLDQISTSEITVAFGVDDGVLKNRKLLNELRRLGDIKIEANLDAISIIGNNINSTPGLIKEIFTALESEGDKISVRMICQGASKHNICFFVLDSEGKKAVKKLHRELIERSSAGFVS